MCHYSITGSVQNQTNGPILPQMAYSIQNQCGHKMTHSVPCQEDIFMEMTGFKICVTIRNHN